MPAGHSGSFFPKLLLLLLLLSCWLLRASPGFEPLLQPLSCRDAEFYGLFDNQQAAINYVTMLVGCE
jgi:hypothetical protein